MLFLVKRMYTLKVSKAVTNKARFTFGSGPKFKIIGDLGFIGPVTTGILHWNVINHVEKFVKVVNIFYQI